MSDLYAAKVFPIDADTDEIVLDESGEFSRLYRVVGASDNPRRLAVHDSPVLLDGDVVDVVYEADHDWFQVYHHWMGEQHRYLPGEWLDEPADLLERLEAGR